MMRRTHHIEHRLAILLVGCATIGWAFLALMPTLVVQLGGIWHLIDLVTGRCGSLLHVADATATVISLTLPAYAVVAIVASLIDVARTEHISRHLTCTTNAGHTRLERARHRVGLHRSVAILDSTDVTAFTAGMIRPRVHVSTATLQALNDDELDAVLAHEDSHVRRRDPLRRAIALGVSRSLAIFPLVRALVRRYVLLLELRADDAAVRRVGLMPVSSALLVFASAASPTPRNAIGMAASELDTRISRLIGHQQQLELVPLRPALQSLLIFTGMCLMLVGVSLVPPM